MAPVAASLDGMTTSSTYLVNALVINRMFFLSPMVVLSGPKRSAGTLCCGSVHWGKGDKSLGSSVPHLALLDVLFDIGVHP